MKKNRSKKQSLETVWAEISAKAWTDKNFKKRLLTHPEEVLKEYGIDTTKTKYKIVENSDTITTLVLPEKPKGELSTEQLKEIAAAGAQIILWKC